jgi:hypothetical protein
VEGYNLNQLRVLRECFDNPNASEFLSMVNPSCSCHKLELLLTAFKSGIDISDLVNCNMSYECLIILVDGKSRGIDVRGLGNELISVELLKDIIKIKEKNTDVDMSFVEDLSSKECNDLVYDYRMWGPGELKKYREKAMINKRMISEEFEFVLNQKKK